LAAPWQTEFERFPPELRVLVEAELAAGNAVAEVTHDFPAPPIGACLMLARQVSTRPRASGGGLDFRARQSSLASGEWTDADRRFFVLEPPGPPPDAPDMDAIRAALVPAPLQEPIPPAFLLEIDRRGEMITYTEQGRLATVICSFGDPPRLIVRTLTDWWHPEERRSVPMTREEREGVLARILDRCRWRHGMSRIERED
jgi:hypothetical protein